MNEWLPTAHTKARVAAPLPESVDVAVIGAGLGGLVAATELALKGHSVAVLDSHYVAGGCATQFSRPLRGGHICFDVGVHYIGDCGPEGAVPGILRELGVEVDFLPLDPDCFDTLVFPDFRVKVPADLDLYRQRLLDLFPAEKSGIDRYLRFLREVDRLASSRGGLRLAMDALLHGRLAAQYMNAPLSELLDSCTKDPRLQAVMVGQNGDYGLPPRKVSAMLHAGLAMHYFKGAWYPKGGGQVIADRLAERLENAGGSIHLRHTVTRVLVDGKGKACGVELTTPKGEARDLKAKLVISNADMIRTLKELVPAESLPTEWKKKADKMEMAGAIFLSCFGVEGGIPGYGNYNIWQFDGYDVEGFYKSSNAGIQPAGCYVTSGSLKDPGSAHHAPAGITSVEVMTLVPGRAEAWGVNAADALRPGYRQRPEYLAKKAEVQADMLRRLDMLFPGTAARVVFQESASPITHSRFTRATDGTGYGLAATPEQFLAKRPGYRGPIPGMYLAGASTRAGHGIVGAMRSGRSCARKILEDLG